MEDQVARTAKDSARVLLAEDNPINREVALNILRRMGLRADAVVNGKEAVLAVEKNEYDIILMDLDMPLLDGLAATRAIREAGRRVPVVALTAHSLEIDRENCLVAGMNDFLAKPLSPETLAITLEKWLPKDAATPPDPNPGKSPGPGRKATASAVFDRSGLLARLLQDRDFARSMVAVFLEEMPRQLALLRESTAAGALESAQGKAHAIRGAAGSIGGCAMRDKAAEVEFAAKAGDLETTKNLVEELEKQFMLLAETMAADFGT